MGDRRAQILSKAESLLFQHGFRAMRVDDLARELGISKRTLYEEFRSKAEITQQVLIELDQRFQPAIRQTAKISDPVERLRSVVELIANIYVGIDPPFFQDAETVVDLSAWVEASQGRCAAAIEAVVRAGIADGTFRPSLDPGVVSQVLLVAMNPGVSIPRRLEAWRARTELIMNGVLG
jgi:AcrR family transcriptional regulator